MIEGLEHMIEGVEHMIEGVEHMIEGVVDFIGTLIAHMIMFQMGLVDKADTGLVDFIATSICYILMFSGCLFGSSIGLLMCYRKKITIEYYVVYTFIPFLMGLLGLALKW